MTVAALCLLVAAGVAAVADWTAVARAHQRLETVTKPAVMVLLMAWVAVVDVERASDRGWVLAALALSLVGDVALLPQVDRFIVGLGAFLLGHLAYLPVLLRHAEAGAVVAAGLVIALIAGLVGRRIAQAAGARHGPALAWAVRGYVVAVGTTAALAVATLTVPVTLGGIAFATSDGVLGWNRFVAPIPRGRLIVHVTYHLAQAGLASIVLG